MNFLTSVSLNQLDQIEQWQLKRNNQICGMKRRNFIMNSSLSLGAGSLGWIPSLAEPTLPKICLLGDSIRMGYAPYVTEILKDKAQIFSPKENGSDSINLLKYLHLWVQVEKPYIVHLNCGLHDLKNPGLRGRTNRESGSNSSIQRKCGEDF